MRVPPELQRLALRPVYRNRWLRRLQLRYVENKVLACAFGGEVEFLGGRDHPVTLLARSGRDVERYALYECEPASSRRWARGTAFRRVDGVEVTPIAGMGLHKFVTTNRSDDRRYFVRATAGARVYDSNVVRAKIGSQPTVRQAEILAANRVNPPSFSWPPVGGRGAVSLLLVSDVEQDELVSGVYSHGRYWTFPNVARVPFYYHRPAPQPAIEPGRSYAATYVAVDRDGWIAYVDTLRFVGAPR